MTFRIFSRLHNLYTNSPSWPSNQRTWSDWALSNSGEVLEMVFADGTGLCSIKEHDKRDFDVEPWTGYFDLRGQKIYRGDILGAFKGVHDEVDPSYETEVVWYEGGFYCKEEQIIPDSWMPLEMENKVWKRHFIKGNIHGIEYAD